ncbi:DUF6011 domain-containing protein [Streptomyces sp. NPDC048290]|uniref:DUF6011 domain-containing protein n=1 Tax=Streptomyces sp. NPDC048290 TaxID=3155811 RepID=UPI00342A527A
MSQETPVRCPCGRLLHDPASRARGVGPVCFRRLSGHTAPRIHIPAPNMASPHIPGQLAIPIQPRLPDA